MKLSKKQNRMNWKNCRISLAKQLWTLRTENRLTIDYVSQKTLLPSFFIENICPSHQLRLYGLVHEC